jgi:hypothetical protein
MKEQEQDKDKDEDTNKNKKHLHQLSSRTRVFLSKNLDLKLMNFFVI